MNTDEMYQSINILVYRQIGSTEFSSVKDYQKCNGFVYTLGLSFICNYKMAAVICRPNDKITDQVGK